MVSTTGAINESYKIYRKEVENPIPQSMFRDIAGEYSKFLLEKVFKGEEVTLPGRLGTLSIVGTKRKLKYDENGNLKLPPNWRKTKELWEKNPKAKEEKKLVYCLNEDTDGVSYKFHWSKNRVAIENKTLYALRISWHNKKHLYNLIKRGAEFFIRYTT